MPFAIYYASPPASSYGQPQSCYRPVSSMPGSHSTLADIPVVIESGTPNHSVVERETWDPKRQKYLPDGVSSASTSRPIPDYAASGSAWSAAFRSSAPITSAHRYIAYSRSALPSSDSSSPDHPSMSSSPPSYHSSTSPSILGSSSTSPTAQRADPYRVPFQSAYYGQSPLPRTPPSHTPPPSASTLTRSSTRSSAYRYSPGQQCRPESTVSSAASSCRTTTTTPHPPCPSSSSGPKRDSGTSFGRPHSPLKVMDPDMSKRKPVAGVGAEGGHVNPEDRLPTMPEWDGHPTALSVPK
ncbi:hypothetical protein JCM1841_001042 [Sporobolomyces salmonicolor]